MNADVAFDTQRLNQPHSSALLAEMDAYWRAANYLSVGQIYLLDNPLLKVPLTIEHVKPRLLGHWGTTPGLNFIYVHLNRVITEHDLNMMYVIGPGHGGPALVANTYLEGTYSEIYPEISQDERGMRRLFKQFSFPGGIPSHVSPEVARLDPRRRRARISLMHAYGAAFDNPDLIVACVVGDGEAETGPLATSWHSNKFLNPAHDGAVLPILHLNGYKIASPTVLGRMSHEELEQLFRGYGYEPFSSKATSPTRCIRLMAAALDRVIDKIRSIQHDARSNAREQTADVADDRSAHAERLDRAEDRGRTADRRIMALAPGAAREPRRQPGAPADAGAMAAKLSPRRAFRCERQADCRARRAGTERRAPHGRESARQRRRFCCGI